jgi:hypothetical protein
MRKTERPDTATDEDQVTTADWVQEVQLHYDPEQFADLTTALVYAIADAMDVDPTEVTDPLYDYVDAAALEETFFGRDAGAEGSQGVGQAEFRYGDYPVTVKRDRWIQVYGAAAATRVGE